MSTKTNYLNSTGQFFHIYNRGVNREPIFLEKRNYHFFQLRIWKYLDPVSLELVAYCLMPNHFHFIVRQDKTFGIAEFFKGVCGGYVKAINKAHRRSGHLFEGKYKMKLIDSDEYLLHLSRYIHLNPVRARLTKKPEDWEFSSCRAYYGMDSTTSISSKYILQRCNGISGYKDFIQNYTPEDKKRIERLVF